MDTPALNRDCRYCVFRARVAGGNGKCSLFERKVNAQRERELEDVAWVRHLVLWPTGCVNFKAGDLRKRVAPAASTEALF